MAERGVITGERSEAENQLTGAAPRRHAGEQVGNQLPTLTELLQQLGFGPLLKAIGVRTTQVGDRRGHCDGIRLRLQITQSGFQFSR